MNDARMRRLLRSLSVLVATVVVVAACSTSSPPERASLASESCDDFANGSVEKLISVTDGDARLDMTTVLSSKDGRVEQHVTVTIAGRPVYRSDGFGTGKSVSVIGKYIGAQPTDDVVVGYASTDGRTGELAIGDTKLRVDMESIKADPTSLGRRLPSVVAPAVRDRIAAVFAKLNAGAPSSCDATSPRPAFSPKAEPGHNSNPGGTRECLDCRFRCDAGFSVCAMVGFYGCMKGCAVLLPLWPAGPVLFSACIIACNGVTLLACDAARQACVDSCDTRVCCPVACGEGCCLSGEQCLEPASRLCCSPGLTPCPGANPSCFDAKKEVCNPTGRACSISRDCGDRCCPTLPNPGTTQIETTCVDPTNGFCCPAGRVLCRPLEATSSDKPGECCAVGFCVRGQCLGSPSAPIPAQ